MENRNWKETHNWTRFFKGRHGLSGFKITSIRNYHPANRIFTVFSQLIREKLVAWQKPAQQKTCSNEKYYSNNILQRNTFHFSTPGRFCSLFITISMNRCTVTDAAQIKCKQHFRPHPPLFITFMRRLIYIYIIIYILTSPLVFSFSPSITEIYIYIYVYTPDYILFIISDHEEKGKSMRNSDYMRVYFPSSVIHIHAYTHMHPSYSFSALVSYSNDCNLKYFSLYRMGED